MAFPRPYHLTAEQVVELLKEFSSVSTVTIYRVRYKNGSPIKKAEEMKVEELQSLILECLEEEHQPGGDLEVFLPSAGKTLIGHHDGVYWLEPRA